MLGMTQTDLAKLAGISTTGLNNIERGIPDPKASTLRALKTVAGGSRRGDPYVIEPTGFECLPMRLVAFMSGFL
jgi:transcriptional regulator with XRE-family HTH domain